MRSTTTVLVTTALVATLCISGTPATAASPGDAPAAKPSPPAADALATPAYALPAWGDGQWGSSENYGTIQTADLDGDGSDELLGRSSTGLEFWDFDATLGQWVPLATTGAPEWTDAGDWDKREYYETISTADVDGDGTADLLARGAAGVEVYRLDRSATPAAWTSLGTATEFDDWSQPYSYQTIQAADVDGDGAAEIFGRDASGFLVADLVDGAWQYTTKDWFVGDIWSAPQYYQTMQAGDLDGDGRDEVLVRDTLGMSVVGVVGSTWTVLAERGPFAGSEFDQPQYFLTISTGDFDGDGEAELYGRDASGVAVYEFTPPSGAGGEGTWTQASTTTAFSGGTWDQASQYRTIQAADVDGDGRDELLGRDADGMTVWGYTGAGGGWRPEQKVAGPAFTDALHWNEPWYYETIQAADVDGVTLPGSPGSANASRADLIGRGPTGIQTYRYDAVSGAWTSPSATFPEWSGTALKAYQALSTHLASATDDIRSQYSVAGASQLDTWAGNAADAPRPKGIPRHTWDEVRAQIHDELTWAYQVASSAANSASLIHTITQYGADDTTVDYLEYTAKQQSDSTIVAGILEYVAGILDGLSNFGEPELQVAAGLLDAYISYAVSAGLGPSSTYAGSYDDLIETHLTSWGEGGGAAVAAARVTIAEDYGLLATVGGLYENAVWEQIDDGSTKYSQLTLAGARAFSIWVWQAVTVDLGEPCKFLWDCNEWGVSTCDAGDAESHDEGYCAYEIGDRRYQLAVIGCETFSESESCNYFAKAVPADAAEHLLSAPKPACLNDTWDPSSCAFGVSAKNVFLNLHGWSYDCTWDSTRDACTFRGDVTNEYGSRSPTPSA